MLSLLTNPINHVGFGAALLSVLLSHRGKRKQGNHPLHTAGNSCRWLNMPNGETMEKLAAKHHVVHGFWSMVQRTRNALKFPSFLPITQWLLALLCSSN